MLIQGGSKKSKLLILAVNEINASQTLNMTSQLYNIEYLATEI